ncbi:MAG: SDR family oxidoreductase [Azospirillaceae bacterium]|nr:SDR family oxidoreductase [Azospirillaceae bacterium]
MRTSGNTILITGGGTGIGRGLAEAFHALGNKVIIAGRRQSVLDETTAANPGMAALTFDVEDRESIRAFATTVTGRYPDLNVLINNAGIMRVENLLTQSDVLADAEATVVTNLLGPIRLTAALLPLLRAQPQATVMMVSSGLAFLPLALTPTYCATKAAIHSYAQSLRYQLKHTPVQVLELAPPYVQTELMGPGQARDPRAMPLKDFIAETIAILTTTPDATEICVEAVKPLRHAEAGGHYDSFFTTFNDTMHS